MLKKLLASGGLLATMALTACQTVSEPVSLACRAPSAEEFEIFRAVISRDTDTLIRYSSIGPARAALERRDPYVNNHLWGNQGYTGGTLVGVLTQPPPCVIDLPRQLDADGNPVATRRSIAVYQEARFRALTGGSISFAPEQRVRLPGVARQDYFRCDFVRSGSSWRMTDLCSMPSARGGIGE